MLLLLLLLLGSKGQNSCSVDWRNRRLLCMTGLLKLLAADGLDAGLAQRAGLAQTWGYV
jgi:hypothetical protein